VRGLNDHVFNPLTRIQAEAMLKRLMQKNLNSKRSA
jgi:hypothetical protein